MISRFIHFVSFTPTPQEWNSITLVLGSRAVPVPAPNGPRWLALLLPEVR